jgi:hypothetical protein
MPRKSAKKKPPSATSVIPEYVQQSRVYQRKKVTKRKLPSFEEAMFLIHVPEMARLYFKAIYEGLQERDKVALEHAGEMLQYVQRKGFSINVAQQMLAQNVAAGETSPVVGFDAFARQLAEARAGHALPPPPEVLELAPAEAVTVQEAG